MCNYENVAKELMKGGIEEVKQTVKTNETFKDGMAGMEAAIKRLK